MSGRVALVTDSTAMLPADLVAQHDIIVVPLQVMIGKRCYREGVDPEATPGAIAAALRKGTPVSTSRPSPQALLDAYRDAHVRGAEAVVSLHLSGELSGTFESAQLAARDAPLPVRPVDTGQLGMAVGYAVRTVAERLAAGAAAEEAAAAGTDRARRTTSLFYVDTLEYLRRGGRIGAAARLVGSALAVKPLLTVAEGRIVPLEKVRTAARALSRLADLAVEAAGTDRVEVGVAHLASSERAGRLADELSGRVADNLAGTEVVVGEVGAVIGAHAGPGLVGVVVAPR
jgi:DegV family protein with EDD domain